MMTTFPNFLYFWEFRAASALLVLLALLVFGLYSVVVGRSCCFCLASSSL